MPTDKELMRDIRDVVSQWVTDTLSDGQAVDKITMILARPFLTVVHEDETTVPNKE